MLLSEAVQVQGLLVIGSIIVAIVGVIGSIALALLNRTRQHSKATRHTSQQALDQVANDHDVNLRDDLDQKFTQLTGLVTEQFSSVRRQLRQLQRSDDAQWREIEDTRSRIPGRRERETANDTGN